MHTVDFVVIGLYLILMMVIGFQCRNSSANFTDYVRMGSRSTWWMAGLSVFMASFSAITFTGIAGSAYLAGWSVLIIFWGNAAVFFIQAMFVAPLLRRTRADTANDAVYLRFGRPVEQLLSYVSTLTSFVWGGTFLLSLATFSSAVFGIPLWVMIIAVGGVVVFYSVAGGTWSVQITDSLQALILIPVTIVFALLCLHAVGGIGGLFSAIENSGFSADYALIKEPDHEYQTPIPVEKGMFTFLWMVANFLGTIVYAFNLQQSSRYLSLKDEKGASKAAWLAGFLMLGGSFVWFIPPMVGRLLFSDQVEAVVGLGNRSDGAFAVTAMNILPPGLMGLLMVCMLAATMSSMDGFLTGSAAIIVKNIYIPFMNKMGRVHREGMALLRLTKQINLLLGLWAICMAFIMSYLAGSGGIFGIIMTTSALIAAPVSMPLSISLICKRIPMWGFFLGVGLGFTASVIILVLQKNGHFVPWYNKIFIMAAVTLIPTYASSLFWKHTSKSFRDHVDIFFLRIRTPVVMSEEIGELVDGSLLRAVARHAMLYGLLILLLLFFAESLRGYLSITGISLFLFGIGGFMWNRANAFDDKQKR